MDDKLKVFWNLDVLVKMCRSKSDGPSLRIEEEELVEKIDAYQLEIEDIKAISEDESYDMSAEMADRNIEIITKKQLQSLKIALKEKNKEFFKRLLPYLEKYDVVECIENLFGDDDERGICAPNTCSRPEEILEYIEYLKSDRFGACLDVGHMLLTADITGDSVCGAMEKLGKHIKVLHVHDNKKKKDEHYPPFMGACDWVGFSKKLKEIGYDGVLSMEIVPYRALPKPNVHALMEFYKFARAVADPDKMI